MKKALQYKIQQQEIGHVRDEVAEGEEEGENELAYLKMPDWKYYSLTLFIYASLIVGSCVISDIGTVFEFVGAFGISFMSFA